MKSKDLLHKSYIAADYVVFLGTSEIVLTIGKCSLLIDALLASKKVEHGVFITAWNPGSILKSDSENQKAGERLLSQIVAYGYDYVNAEGRDTIGDWPVERGIFIFGVPLLTAESLAGEFGQRAYVLAERGLAVQLVYSDI